MITKSIDVMYSIPGIWSVVCKSGVFFVEIEEDVCYQLNPATFEKDGELRKGRWRVDTISVMIGPLDRKK